MNPTPLISIIIPTYNRRDFLARAIQSVLDQSYYNWELIIVDDGSSDDTDKLVAQYSTNCEKIKYTKNTGRKGPAGARNHGISQTNGDIIAFLDSDDTWVNNKLEIQIDYLRRNPEIKALGADSYISKGGKTYRRSQIVGKIDLSKDGIKDALLQSRFYMQTGSILIYKEVFKKVGLFDEDYLRCEDIDLWLRINEVYRFGYISEPLFSVYWEPDRYNKYDDFERATQNMDNMIYKLFDKVEKTIPLNDRQKDIIAYRRGRRGVVEDNNQSSVKLIKRGIGNLGLSIKKVSPPIYYRLKEIVTKHSKSKTSSFFAITTFYNPACYKNKYKNYKLFRSSSKKQGLKLVAVELAFEDRPFELKSGDAEILIQIRGKNNNIMWQKEALINIGIKNLPMECDKFAWLDCDIIFQNRNWIKESVKLLDKYKIIQPFSHIVRMGKDMKKINNPSSLPVGNNDMERSHNITYGVVNFGENILTKGYYKYGVVGFAWAARKEIFSDLELFDSTITGSGDLLIANAFFNCQITDIERDFPDKLIGHYKKWATKTFSLVGKDISCVSGDIFHLWHGDRENRRYVDRHVILKQSDFDPVVDIRKTKSGIWEWSSNKREMHQKIKQYFFVRNEDSSSPDKHFFSKLSVCIKSLLSGSNQ